MMKAVTRRLHARQMFPLARACCRQQGRAAHADSQLQGEAPGKYEYHTPVMLAECLEYLDVKPGGLYIDCTLGGGGHSRAILERGGRVIGIDQDPQALTHAALVCREYIGSGHMEIFQANFRDAASTILSRSTLLATRNAEGQAVGGGSGADGVLLDLGVSSHQIDEASRGFAFGQEGPLDMRMCQSGDISSSSSPPTELALTAAHVVNEWDPDTIAAVLQRFGDETNHRAIAKQIVLRRPLTSTLQLEAAISGVTPWRRRAATLARCFQALRIVVNDEMSALDEALAQAAGYVCEGGRLVVLSYHSLEDRKVKRLLRGLRTEGSPVPAQQPPRRNATGKGQGREQRPTLPWEPLLKKAQVASAAEVALNGRARSAKLRAAVRTALPHQQV